jgi:hypothetical protein
MQCLDKKTKSAKICHVFQTLFTTFVVFYFKMSAVTLHTTNFPLYTVNVLDKDHFVVAGGGGSAKTGVPNALV